MIIGMTCPDMAARHRIQDMAREAFGVLLGLSFCWALWGGDLRARVAKCQSQHILETEKTLRTEATFLNFEMSQALPKRQKKQTTREASPGQKPKPTKNGNWGGGNKSSRAQIRRSFKVSPLKSRRPRKGKCVWQQGCERSNG